jgi:hypothetical protein
MRQLDVGEGQEEPAVLEASVEAAMQCLNGQLGQQVSTMSQRLVSALIDSESWDRLLLATGSGTPTRHYSAVSCGIGDNHIWKHNNLRDTLFQTCQQAQLGPLKEPVGLLPVPYD